MNQTPQLDSWDHIPRQREVLWSLTKRGKIARGVLLTHQLGWELKIDSADILLTQVVRSDREIEEVSAEWKAAMIEKRWR